MKIGQLMLISLLLTVSISSYSQKAKVLSAYKYYQIYLSNKKCSELGEAKSAVDIAINDIQTAQWSKTWFYRGNIYFELAISENAECTKLSDSALNVAYHAYIKALELDVKKHYVTEIQTQLAVVGPYFLNYGVQAYNNENFLKSLRSFQKSMHISEVFKSIDTLGMYNAALAAEQLGKYDIAQQYYEKLTTVNYGGAKIYSFLANSHLKQKDSTNQIAWIKKGRALFPHDQNLITEELNYYLEHKKYEDALTVLTSVIQTDPNNSLMLYYKGTVHDNLEQYKDAARAYKRSIAIKPDYFDANFNMGALLFNEGLDINEQAYLGEEVDRELLDKARVKFREAVPYLEKAREINNFDKSTLVSLQKIYSILGEDDKYQTITEELEN